MVIQVAPISSKPDTADHVAPEPMRYTDPQAPKLKCLTTDPTASRSGEDKSSMWMGGYQVGPGFFMGRLNPSPMHEVRTPGGKVGGYQVGPGFFMGQLNPSPMHEVRTPDGRMGGYQVGIILGSVDITLNP